MRICRFDNDRLGIVRGDKVHDVTVAQDEIRAAARYDMRLSVSQIAGARRVRATRQLSEPVGNGASNLVRTVFLHEVKTFDKDVRLVGKAFGKLPDPACDEHAGLRIEKELRQRRR